MHLDLKRNGFSSASTLGDLTIDGTTECFCLENPLTGNKPHVAIPAGTYSVILSFSLRFKRKFPLLVSVPGFEGIRIHYGCFSRDTIGCILVGQQKGPERLYNSRAAFRQLLTKLSLADLNHEKIDITIS